MDIGRLLQTMDERLKRVERSSRLSHAAIDDTSVQVRDASGNLRGLLGVQADGTTAVNIVNGAAPPQPTDPTVTSVLGGVTVSWDGQFTDDQMMPLDWARVEVHASILPSYDPIPATLQGTIETAQGATVVVPCDTDVYVRLLARNTSGTASTPSAIVGPYGPTPVVADDIQDGIVTTIKLADDAVTAAKVAVGAIGSDQLALGIGNLAPDPSFEGAYTAALVTGHADWTITAPGNNSPHALHVDCTSGGTTWKNIELARYPVLPGERHYLAVDYKTSATFNGTGVKLMFRYEDAIGTVLGYGVADHAFTPGDPWARATAQVQAPTGTVTAVLLVEASAVTAGEAWFDNAEVYTLVVGGMVAAGTITATELAALTILAGNIAADAIAAGKIAADAVTAREIAALTITAAEMAANSITVGKLAAGSVDATALAADAITGKTITGGTITGSLIQTAASGERVTLNAGGLNKVLVHNSAGTAIGELSSTGLAVKGTNGSVLWLDPNDPFPNLRLTNAAQTNSAVINVSGTNARIGVNSGIFTERGYTDMKWRSFSGEGFAVIEQVRDSDVTKAYGGRVSLNDDQAVLSYVDADDATQDTRLYILPGYAQMDEARLDVLPPASASSALLVNAATGHTGNLLRLALNGTDKFVVDEDGNVTIAGIGRRLWARKTGDTGPRTSTTPSADPHLSVTVDPGTYRLEAFIKWSGDSASDINWGWNSPASTSGSWVCYGGDAAMTAVPTTMRTIDTSVSGGSRSFGVISTVTGQAMRGTVRITTAGTFSANWSAQTASGTGVSVLTDSWIHLEREE